MKYLQHYGEMIVMLFLPLWIMLMSRSGSNWYLLHEQKEQRLSDVVLAEKLGVSRTPVRQALERLVQDGLVRSDPRRGFWVRTFTAQDIHEIYDLRGALEVLALRLAAPHLDPADLRSQLTLSLSGTCTAGSASRLTFSSM